VSSKQLTAFSDHRFPLDSPDHISLPQYVLYLESYVNHFRLAPHINLHCRVVSVTPLDGEGSKDNKWRHRVKYVANGNDERAFDCSHVAVCTGLHVQPDIPSIPGIEHINGEIFHSAQYKHRSQLAGRDVLILGCGETAMGKLKPSDIFLS
jgi:dimethylaniline monooxygenase (N-oxide forming)